MNARLQRALTSIARKYAPEVLSQSYADEAQMARALATYGALTLTGDIAPGSTPAGMLRYLQEWVEGYTRLYRLLSASLFPSFVQLNSFNVDRDSPPVVVLLGEAIPVIEVMAGFIAPYVVQRQGSTNLAQVELLGLMDTVLEELEAGDLPREDYRTLRNEGANLLRPLLYTSIRQYPLTPPLRPIFGDVPTTPGDLRPQPPPPELPPSLPEQDRLGRNQRSNPQQQQQTRGVDPLPPPPMPLFFDRESDPAKRRPPVPEPPKRNQR